MKNLTYIEKIQEIAETNYLEKFKHNSNESVNLDIIEDFLDKIWNFKNYDELRDFLNSTINLAGENTKEVAILIGLLIIMDFDKNLNLDDLDKKILSISKTYNLIHWPEIKKHIIDYMGDDLIKAGKIDQLLALDLKTESKEKVFEIALDYVRDNEEINIGFDKNNIVSTILKNSSFAEICKFILDDKNLINFIEIQLSLKLELVKKVANFNDIFTLVPEDINTYVKSLKSLNLLNLAFPAAKIEQLSSDKLMLFIKTMYEANTIDDIFKGNKLFLAKSICKLYQTANREDQKILEKIYDNYVYNPLLNKSEFKGMTVKDIIKYVENNSSYQNDLLPPVNRDLKLQVVESYKFQDILKIHKALEGSTKLEKIIDLIAAVITKITGKSFTQALIKNDNPNTQISR